MLHILAYPKTYFRTLKLIIFIFCALPLFVLIIDFYTDNLGINKLERLTYTTGIWALNMQLIALAITPLRRLLTRIMMFFHTMYGKRLSDWNWMVKLRRMVGLYAFFYASLHLIIFYWLDQDFDWEGISFEIAEKQYIVLGLLAWLLLVPIAVTSNDRAMRWLGKRWRQLHRFVYLVAILSVMHYLWLSKIGVFSAWWYIGIVVILLGYRLLIKLHVLFRRPTDDGMEVAERPNRKS